MRLRFDLHMNENEPCFVPAAGEFLEKLQIVGGGQELVWSPDGSEIYYRSGQKMMAVSVRTNPTLQVGGPHELFEGTQFTAGAGGARQYHIAPDGRFLMVREGEAATGASQTQFDHLVVVENWFDELRRLAPVD